MCCVHQHRDMNKTAPRRRHLKDQRSLHQKSRGALGTQRHVPLRLCHHRRPHAAATRAASAAEDFSTQPHVKTLDTLEATHVVSEADDIVCNRRKVLSTREQTVAGGGGERASNKRRQHHRRTLDLGCGTSEFAGVCCSWAQPVGRLPTSQRQSKISIELSPLSFRSKKFPQQWLLSSWCLAFGVQEETDSEGCCFASIIPGSFPVWWGALIRSRDLVRSIKYLPISCGLKSFVTIS